MFKNPLRKASFKFNSSSSESGPVGANGERPSPLPVKRRSSFFSSSSSKGGSETSASVRTSTTTTGVSATPEAGSTTSFLTSSATSNSNSAVDAPFRQTPSSLSSRSSSYGASSPTSADAGLSAARAGTAGEAGAAGGEPPPPAQSPVSGAPLSRSATLPNLPGSLSSSACSSRSSLALTGTEDPVWHAEEEGDLKLGLIAAHAESSHSPHVQPNGATVSSPPLMTTTTTTTIENGNGKPVEAAWEEAAGADGDDEHRDVVASLPASPQSSRGVALVSPLHSPSDPSALNGATVSMLALSSDAALPSAAAITTDRTSDPTSPPAAGPSSDSTHKHHHHHHHHHSHSSHSHHTHSPPHVHPPVRAATLNSPADLAAITPSSVSSAAGGAAADGPKSPTGEKKRGFMGIGRLSAKKEAAALAAATLALKRKEEEANLTPQQKIDRAKQAERAHLLQTCMELGVEIYDIAPDGHCLYAAIADQLHILRIITADENHPQTTRAAAATYMLANPDSFMPFLIGMPPDPNDPDTEGEEEDGMMTIKGFERYCKRVRESGEWGGEPEILALSRYYKVPIHVIQSQNPKIVAHSPDPKAMATLTPAKAKKIKACRISYHRRLYGLGEHYNSLRKIQYNLTAFSTMVPM